MALLMEERFEGLADLRERAQTEVAKVVVGQERTVELMLVAALAHGRVLLEGPPGSAKTLLSRAVAHMDAVGRYIVAVGRRTRNLPDVELGASSRSLIHLLSASKACARLNGRSHVTVSAVREMAPFVLRHRLMVCGKTTQEDALRLALDSVPAPVESVA